MKIKIKTLFARGFDESLFWKCYSFAHSHKGVLKSIATLMYMRLASKQAGYIGRGTILKGCPHLPHGFHGVHLSMDAVIGTNVTIYQNVTIGRAHNKAPIIGNNCVIGCNSVILGGVKVGDGVKIGAGSVVVEDIPDNSTVVPVKSRIFFQEK